MSKQRLEHAFQQVEKSGGKAFVPYIMAGDGGLESLEEKILFLAESGVTAIELGIPFSDPVADGPTIQAAGQRALAEGTTLRKVLAYLEGIKEKVDVPLILMTYFNPVYQYGVEAFSKDAGAAGVSGLIIPDLPVEQSDIVTPFLRQEELALIQLVTLMSPEERIRKIAEASEGFVYAVTVNGITGARSGVSEHLGSYLKRIKQYSHVPVLAGFGISSPEHVQDIGSKCDGVIVGSKIISLWEEGKQDEIHNLIKASNPLIL
ncbi:tryptophan synthase subunit alpha [Salinibacillus xinjiangensis]|uniref:Tryptophan synthase alpha chain n=1 Tax=Salinibacillus xinjiangensis TaxID=1229268 RepID=A0A6G1X9G9_9BACI|nr:tryptophan synthase subunit alpha [Salinibacillus xinjiangensis]MRG87546.1 tryptophan synthase subunit alpha [Salinibacillus xinjiangensis]